MNMYLNARRLALASAISAALLASASSLAADEQTNVITEARQSTQIWTTYALNPNLQAHDLKVSVEDGVATLTGKVDEDIGKELAEQIALNVTGIREVNNQIEVDYDYKPTPDPSERSYGDRISDASITATVKSKLLWSRHSQGLSANVETVSGKVTLEGTADSTAAKEMAGLLASNTQGVTDVDNKLKVEDTSNRRTSADRERSSIGQGISDTWITTKVKSTLIYSSNVASSDISVHTDDGVVTLTGSVSNSAEHALAVELAKNVKGVKRVNADALKDQRS
ncbi:MAG: BON domain-containing protein [Marinobacter sp.]|nr:BON domain-containing protein [Marinobacter sp.]